VPPRNRRTERSAVPTGASSPDALSRIANLLALLVVKDMGPDDQVFVLAAAGFGNQEVAALLDKSSNAVAQALVRRRRKGGAN